MNKIHRQRISLGTIQARMVTVFVIILGVLMLVSLVAVLVMGQVQNVVNEFIATDFPKAQQTNSINYLVENVSLGAKQLSEAQTKNSLEASYDNIDMPLLKLEITADTLSYQGVIDSRVLEMMYQVQQVRSQAQLGLQLKGASLQLAADLQRMQSQGLEAASQLVNLVCRGSSPLDSQQSLCPSAQTLMLLLARLSPEESQDVRQVESQLTTAIAPLAAALETLPVEQTEVRIVLQRLVEINWGRCFTMLQRQQELATTSEAVLQNLQQTVERVVVLAEGYTQKLLTDFEERKLRVLAVERWAERLVLGVSLLAALTIAIVQRQLVIQSFSRRLAVISQALSSLPKTPEDTQVEVFGHDELAMMARRLEVLLEKALQTQIMATKDELTQLQNRRSFFQLTAIEREEASCSGRRDCLLMLDIDLFKRINDSYGHDMGDRVLKSIAQTCRSCLRETDILARMGGEEFSIYCPDTDQEAGRQLAEQICNRVRGLQFSPISYPITLSVGVVEIPADAVALAQWLKLADEALYTAKSQGRDRVVVAASNRAAGT